DALTGTCSSPEKPDGTLCVTGTCKAGACVDATSGSSSAGGGSTSEKGGGCGCRVAGNDDDFGGVYPGLGAALAAASRRRSNRRAGSALDSQYWHRRVRAGSIAP